MTETPDTTTGSAPSSSAQSSSAESSSATDQSIHRDARLNRMLAWVGIVAGIVFIVGAVFVTGFFAGRAMDGPGWHRGSPGAPMRSDGPMGGCPMMPMMQPGGMKPGMPPSGMPMPSMPMAPMAPTTQGR
jgi:hypothetical protein